MNDFKQFYKENEKKDILGGLEEFEKTQQYVEKYNEIKQQYEDAREKLNFNNFYEEPTLEQKHQLEVVKKELYGKAAILTREIILAFGGPKELARHNDDETNKLLFYYGFTSSGETYVQNLKTYVSNYFENLEKITKELEDRLRKRSQSQLNENEKEDILGGLDAAYANLQIPVGAEALVYDTVYDENDFGGNADYIGTVPEGAEHVCDRVYVKRFNEVDRTEGILVYVTDPDIIKAHKEYSVARSGPKYVTPWKAIYDNLVQNLEARVIPCLGRYLNTI